jgi:hypothetical protein
MVVEEEDVEGQLHGPAVTFEALDEAGLVDGL